VYVFSVQFGVLQAIGGEEEEEEEEEEFDLNFFLSISRSCVSWTGLGGL